MPAPWTLICTTSHTWRPSPPEAKVSRRHQHGRAHATPGPFERHNFCAQRDKKIFISILKLLKFTGFPSFPGEWFLLTGNHGCLPYDDVSWGCFFLFREKGILYQVHRYEHVLESRYCIPRKRRRRHRIAISQVAEAARSHTTSKAQCCKPRAREQWTPLLVCFIGYNSLVSSQINPCESLSRQTGNSNMYLIHHVYIHIYIYVCIYIYTLWHTSTSTPSSGAVATAPGGKGVRGRRIIDSAILQLLRVIVICVATMIIW